MKHNIRGQMNQYHPAKIRLLFTLMITFLLALSLGNQVYSQPINIRVHDPSMVEQNGTYYIFCTGRGITVYSSPDMKNWKRQPPVFDKAPDWTQKIVPGFRNREWAPDISYHHGKYYLYYAVSAFGKNTSAIGLAVNSTLDSSDPDYHWKDLGYVIRSIPGRDLWNAIDPQLFVDQSGTPWLVFGSFWHGIKMIKMEPDLKHIAKSQKWCTLASRERSWKTPDQKPGKAAIEAPFIFHKGDYYYLFVSYDYCCRGVNSNYKVMVGRSRKVTGPYVDKNGIKMRDGGATLFLKGNQQWPGVGHEGVYTFDGKDYIIFHGYDASDHGKPKLWIERLQWTEDGWPEASLKE
jgi:arabinan endo-1,5-alpha-L-arabinosidase